MTSHGTDYLSLSVTVANKLSQSLLEGCITSTKSVDNTEWIYSTCHSNLTDRKLPAFSKADKMQFPKDGV